MKFFKFVLGFLALIASTQVLAGAEGKGGGAGCPQSDGSIITLLECGAYQEPTLSPPPPPGPPLAIDGPSEIPEGLRELVNYIKTFPYLDESQKKMLVSAIEPSFFRKYFFVNSAPDLTQTIVDRIKGQFQRVTNLHPSQLILYGVTDTAASMSNTDRKVQITYLLPAFKHLKTMEEKMTALIHENYWVLRHDATYLDVVEAEMAFEAAMQRPNDTTRVIEYVNSVFKINHYVSADGEFTKYLPSMWDHDDFDVSHSSSPMLMQLLLKRDLEKGALKGFVNDQNEITNTQLFGAENIQCIRDIVAKTPNFGYYSTSEVYEQYQICAIKFLNYRDALLRSYPNSLFLAVTKFIKLSTSYGLVNPIWRMMNVLSGEILFSEFKLPNNSNSELKKNSEPLFAKLFSWDVSKSRNHKNCMIWWNKGPSNDVVPIKLTTDVNNHGPFGPIQEGISCQ